MIDFIKIIGGGSTVMGIIVTPFFIIGAIQIFRGFCAVFNADLKKMETQNDSIWHYLYIPVTVLGYIAVIVVSFLWGVSIS